MKKVLSAALCAVLLLGLAPAVAPPALMVTGGVGIDAGVSAAYVGDTVTFRTFGFVSFGGTLLTAFRYYRNMELLFERAFPPNNPWVSDSIQPASPGRYIAHLRMSDSGPNEFSVFSAPVQVSLRPAPKNVTVAPVNGTALKITWGAVPGAGGYEVWRSEFRAGPYALVRATTATSWSNTYLTP
ncbi:MAG TPA: hypothetical protein VLA21_06190, partial [Candidatus Limnocylindria bacterium]|nr:hypothetical protein [Candidatus Limnocylindria bacterium]